MNRLTEKRGGRNVVRCDQLSCNSCGICAATNCCKVEQAALDKLAAYEATGLEPEEIGTANYSQINKALQDKGFESLEAFLEVLNQVKPAHPKWISVKNRRPKPFRHVLVWCQKAVVGCRTGDGFWITIDPHYVAGEVTHWMPLPEGPVEEQYE